MTPSVFIAAGALAPAVAAQVAVDVIAGEYPRPTAETTARSGCIAADTTIMRTANGNRPPQRDGQ